MTFQRRVMLIFCNRKVGHNFLNAVICIFFFVQEVRGMPTIAKKPQPDYFLWCCAMPWSVQLVLENLRYHFFSSNTKCAHLRICLYHKLGSVSQLFCVLNASEYFQKWLSPHNIDQALLLDAILTSVISLILSVQSPNTCSLPGITLKNIA